MLLKLTAAEQNKLQAIRDSYQPERERLAEAFRAADNEEEKRDIARKKQALFDGMQMEIDAFLDKAQRKRFKKVEAGGVQAIIDNAKEQAPGLLEDIHKTAQMDCNGLKPETIEEIGIGSVKGGAFLLKANYAAQALREELYLHLEALQDNREALQTLIGNIIREAEQSPFTDGEKATKPPLVKIDKYGMMRDNLAARILQESDLFSTELNGQFMMQWKVNEGEEDGVKLVAKIALIYEDPDENQIAYKKRRLTFTDKGLYEIVGSLFNYQMMVRKGERFTFSPWQIAKANLGQANNPKTPSKNQIKTAERCIDKWLSTKTVIDITDEVTRKRIDGYVAKNGIMEAQLLKANKYVITDSKGQEHVYYEMRAVEENEPILYKYNKAKGHILEVPYTLLDISEYVTRIETYTITFRNYLLMRIALMYQKKGLNSNRILFSTLYEYTKVPTPEDPEGRTKDLEDIKNMIEGKSPKDAKHAEEKKEEEKKKEYAKNTRQTIIRRYRQRDKEQIFGILQCWTDKGWIKGFSPVKKGQTVIGVDIMLNPANKQKN